MIIKPFVRNPHNYDVDEVSDETGLTCPEKTLTQQQFLQESDINYIANQFMKTGEIPQVLNLPQQGDFEGVFDFQSAMNLIVRAKQEFASLPAKIRSRFDNDPQKILDFLDDPNNRAEAEAIGLIQRKEPTDETRTGTSTQTTTQTRPGDTRTQATPDPARPAEKS